MMFLKGNPCQNLRHLDAEHFLGGLVQSSVGIYSGNSNKYQLFVKDRCVHSFN